MEGLRFCRGVTPNMATTSQAACFADISAPPLHAANVCNRVGSSRSAEKPMDANRAITLCYQTQLTITWSASASEISGAILTRMIAGQAYQHAA